ncbi:MAG: methylmalonyl-CoA mutase family protein, partial [Bdellovibrionales bacterium]|nr:methylmalonyl-CoA mutase family protein [Bdellovibrionales bacterium]
QYQRGKIQDESMLYEHLKHSGELPVIGVNTFVDPKTLVDGYEPPKIELARASYEEKDLQLNRVRKYQEDHRGEAEQALRDLREAALSGKNIFGALMDAARVCSLYQMTQALYEAGGQYRRNL